MMPLKSQDETGVISPERLYGASYGLASLRPFENASCRLRKLVVF
jgi:hypothetical protein